MGSFLSQISNQLAGSQCRSLLGRGQTIPRNAASLCARNSLLLMSALVLRRRRCEKVLSRAQRTAFGGFVCPVSMDFRTAKETKMLRLPSTTQSASWIYQLRNHCDCVYKDGQQYRNTQSRTQSHNQAPICIPKSSLNNSTARWCRKQSTSGFRQASSIVSSNALSNRSQRLYNTAKSINLHQSFCHNEPTEPTTSSANSATVAKRKGKEEWPNTSHQHTSQRRDSSLSYTGVRPDDLRSR
jgi:hypothetical protein